MSISAMKQALEAFEDILSAESRGFGMEYIKGYCETMTRELRQAIAEAEKQEPARWVGLTDEDIAEIKQNSPVYVSAKAVSAIVPMVEAKLNEKNA
jgi:hypothetical protein